MYKVNGDFHYQSYFSVYTQWKGLIKPGSGAWSSAVVMVKKKDSAWRFCMDYISLKGDTKVETYPLPRNNDSFNTLGGSRWISTLDCVSGYWQVE